MTGFKGALVPPSRWSLIVFADPVIGARVFIAWRVVFWPPVVTDAPWHSRIVLPIAFFGPGWVIGTWPAMLAACWWLGAGARNETPETTR